MSGGGLLVVGYALSWFDAPAGSVIAGILGGGWFVVRGRVRALAADRPGS